MDPILTCVHCPRLCHDVCPTVRSEHRETPSPTSLLTLIHFSGLDPQVPQSEILQALDHCLLCSRCTATCELNMTPWEEIRKTRGRLRSELKVPFPWSWEDLWAPAPVRHSLGYGLEPWLLVGSLTGIEVGSLLKHLGGDMMREWWFPRRGLPRHLYASWALGYERVLESYGEELSREILSGGFRGVAWADPHEGRAVQWLLSQLNYQGKKGYAPKLLGIVEEERFACEHLEERFGCCGAAGGYPLVDPEHARFLAEHFPGGSRAVPGICRAHLLAWNRREFHTDWREP